MDIQFYKCVLEECPIGYAYSKIILSATGKPENYEFIEVNAAFEELLGKQRSQILGKKVTEVIPDIKESQFDWIRFFGEVALGGSEKVIEYCMGDRKKCYRISTYSPKTEFFITYYADVTEEKMQIQDSLLDAIPVPVFYKDNHGRYLGFNKAFEEFFGKSKEQLIGKSVFDISPKHLASIYHKMDVELFEKITKQIYESQVKDAFGELHDVVFHKATTTDSRGNINGLIGTILDITDRKCAEEAVKNSQKKLKEIIDFLPDATFAVDKDKNIIIWNKAMEKMTGIKANEVIENNYRKYTAHFYGKIRPVIIDLIFEDDMWIESQYDQVRREGETINAEAYCPALYNGKGAWLAIKATALHDSNGNVIGAIESIRDISERKEMENTIAEEKILLETTLMSVGDGVISTDIDGKIVLINRVVEQLTQLCLSDVKGKILKEVFCVMDEYSGEKYDNIIEHVIQTGLKYELPEHAILVAENGKKYPVEGGVAPILDVRSKIVGTVLVFRNISDKKVQRERIEYLSFHDALTGLYNRHFFETEMKRIDTARNLPLAVIMGDVNGLKLTNDIFGHELGDKLLTTIASILKRFCREDDIVARWGGDEFTLLLPKTYSDKAASIIERITKAVSEETIATIQCSISMGFDCKTDMSEDINYIVRNAEENMYKAKTLERHHFKNKSFEAIIKAHHKRDLQAESHSKRVSKISGIMAKALEFPNDMVTKVKQAAYFHDVGKIGINHSGEEQSKPIINDSKTDLHPIIGYRILNSFDKTMDIAEIVLCHHEEWDGSGYPKGLKHEDIPIASRIIHLVDYYDHLVHITDKTEINSEDVLQIIKLRSGYQFDPQLVDTFLELYPIIRDISN